MSVDSTSPAPVSVSNSTSSAHQNVVPSEVGWQFVPQYYTFVNKQPNRLHCFYTKKSTFIHGTEGEDGRPCYGQQEIHQKILSIGFQDCKVFIHSVDAQASTGNGIIIQVIGEMSNRGEAWRKFVQTFFLAEQPNGYFVLNDIFRFLKEESVEDDEATKLDEPQPDVAPAAATRVEHEPPVANIPVPEPIPASEPTPVEEPAREQTPEPEPTPAEEPAKPQPNGLHQAESEKEPEPEPAAESIAPQEPIREPTPTAAPAPAPSQPSPVPSPAAPAAQPAPTPAPQQQQPQQPLQSTAPPAPKTWANLAAANSKKWGAAVAQESRGMSVEAVVAPQPPPRSATNTPVSTSAAGGPRPAAGAGARPKDARINHHLYQQAMGVTTPHVFVKGLIDPIENEDLEALLVKHGGKIKEIEFVRTSACAFVEYEDVKSAQRAIVASLNVGQGGEGGIFYRPESGDSLRLIVETKKERGERPPPRGRGGMPPQGGRGNFRGRGRGRGVPAGKPM